MPQKRDMRDMPSSHSVFHELNSTVAAAHDGSAESSRSSLLSPPKLNFFGLVDSQSQSQYNNDDFNAFGNNSQKENVDVDMDKGTPPDALVPEVREPSNPPLHTPPGTPPEEPSMGPSSSRRLPRSNTKSRPQSFRDLIPGIERDEDEDDEPDASRKPHVGSAEASGAEEADDDDDDDESAEAGQVFREDVSDDEMELDNPIDEMGLNSPIQEMELNNPIDDFEDNEYDLDERPRSVSPILPESQDRIPTQYVTESQVTPDGTQCTQAPDEDKEDVHASDVSPKDYAIINRIVNLSTNREVIKQKILRALPEFNLNGFNPDDYRSETQPSQTSSANARYAALLGDNDDSHDMADSEAGPSNWVETQAAKNHWAQTQPARDANYQEPRRALPPPRRTLPPPPPPPSRAKLTRDDSRSEIIPDSDPQPQPSQLSTSTHSSLPRPQPSAVSMLRNDAKAAVDKSSSTEADDSADIVPDSLELEAKEEARLNKSLARRQEEEEEEEDDEPLKLPTTQPKPKSKEPAGVKIKPKPASGNTTTKAFKHKPISSKPESIPKASSTVPKRKRVDSDEEDAASCSAPDMPPPPPANAAKRGGGKGKGKAKAPAATRKSSRRGKSRQVTETLSGDEEEEEEYVIPKRERESTLLVGTSGAPKAKRARHNPRATPLVAVKREPGASTSKGMKSRSTFIPKVVDDVMAFAKWDSMFYACKVQAMRGTNKVSVAFLDDNSIEADLTSLRRFQFLEGDAVMVIRHPSPDILDLGEIVDPRVSEQNMVLVHLHEEEEPRMVNIKDIRLSSKVVHDQWKTRVLRVEDILPEGGLFSGYAFVVTWSGDEDVKNGSIDGLCEAGASIVDNWHNLIEWNGEFSGDNWSIARSDAKWKGSNKIQRVFLVADAYNEKPKYLIALALGIPCVSAEWTNASIKAGRVLDWRPYILPAGVYSDRLVSQLVDLGWGDDATSLATLLNNPPVAMRLLRGQDVVCDAALMPKRELDAKDGLNTIPLILFAMGADTVKVTSGALPKRNTFPGADMIVYHGGGSGSSAVKPPKCDHPNLVDWKSLKAALIMGRFVH